VPETLRFMRLLVLAFVAALSLTSLAAAQSTPKPAQQTDRLFVEDLSAPPQVGSATSEQERLDGAYGVCYTMRSYIFERRGTEAPRRVGMVTCTRSSQRQFKRAKPAPKPNIIPAD
jgi:hypothetical protein